MATCYTGTNSLKQEVEAPPLYLTPPSLISEFLAELFQGAGLHPVTNDYVLRETVNKKEGLCVPRVFLQSKFIKPPANQGAAVNEAPS